MLFRTVGGVAGSVVVSQVSPGRKNRLQFEMAGAEATLGFDQEQPETLWVGRRPRPRSSCGTPPTSPPRPRPTPCCRRGTPRATRTASTPSSADTYRAIRRRGAAAVDGLPTFADGARAADITDAVLRSAKGRTWEEVPSR